jgi:hypothetical protein
MELKLFPIPKSEISIKKTGPDSFDVECSYLDSGDYHRLRGFFEQMLGRFGEFRFEYAGVVHPKCRFDSDAPNFATYGPDRHSVALPIKILR